MGAILKKSGWRRSSYMVSSKVFFGCEGDRPNEDGLSRKHVVEACHDALRRLQVDYLDLYYCHRPDPAVPVEETCRAMHDLIVQGKVLYWGTSEWSAAQIEAAHAVCDRLRPPPPDRRAARVQPFPPQARREGIRARSTGAPASGRRSGRPSPPGLLTGKYNKGVPKGTAPRHARAWNGCATRS